MKRRRPAGTPLADAVSSAMAPIVAEHGFATAELIARWPDLVGPHLRDVTRPLRVVWPRFASELADTVRRAPATLVVQCEGAYALDLQHHAPILIERIAVLYGWRAVERITIRQGPVPRTAASAPPAEPAPATPDLTARLDGIADENLRSALERLGRTLASRRRDDE